MTLTHNQIIFIGHKLLRESFTPELKDKKRGFFDWQYSDSSIEDKEIEFEFYWDSVDCFQVLMLGQLMIDLTQYSPRLAAGKHDNSNNHYQIKLILIKKL